MRSSRLEVCRYGFNDNRAANGTEENIGVLQSCATFGTNRQVAALPEQNVLLSNGAYDAHDLVHVALIQCLHHLQLRLQIRRSRWIFVVAAVLLAFRWAMSQLQPNINATVPFFRSVCQSAQEICGRQLVPQQEILRFVDLLGPRQQFLPLLREHIHIVMHQLEIVHDPRVLLSQAQQELKEVSGRWELLRQYLIKGLDEIICPMLQPENAKFIGADLLY